MLRFSLFAGDYLWSRVTSAQPTSFLYDPLELRLIGNHQMFYVENKNWLSSMSIRKISISALYTDSDGHITSLGMTGCSATLLAYDLKYRVEPSELNRDDRRRRREQSENRGRFGVECIQVSCGK